MGEDAAQRYGHNMMKAQWAFTQIVADMTGAILKWFHRELFCPLGFIACAIQMRTVRARKEEDGTIVDVLIANKFALANSWWRSRCWTNWRIIIAQIIIVRNLLIMCSHSLLLF